MRRNPARLTDLCCEMNPGVWLQTGFLFCHHTLIELPATLMNSAAPLLSLLPLKYFTLCIPEQMFTVLFVCHVEQVLWNKLLTCCFQPLPDFVLLV